MAGSARTGALIVLIQAALCVACGREPAADDGPPPLPPQITLRACEFNVPAEGAMCASHEVFEDRQARTGRRIALNIVVLPALTRPAEPDPVFWLEGGPGGAATGAIGPVNGNYLRAVRQRRDLVFVDVRGTGRSHPLMCDDIGDRPGNLDRFFGPLFPQELIRECRDRLQPIADLTKYTTSLAMDDLEEVRQGLGYRTINLVGASHGTIAAQVYMRAYPDRVRSAFLLGVATTAFELPLPFPRASQAALDLTFADCEADPACRAAFPNVRREFDLVLARFGPGPLRVTVDDSAAGRPRQVVLERESFVERIRGMLYSTVGARFVPLVVHRAFQNDFIPFQVMATRFRPGGNSAARGFYFSVTCAETVPFITPQEIEAETRGTFLGDRRIRSHIAACQEWPRGSVPANFAEPLVSEIPTVLFSGDADGATPPWIADAAERLFPNGRKIRASRTGHQIEGPCTWDLMSAFIIRPVARDLDASCATGFVRPPFATDLPRQP